jgi:hypothetical protein
VILDTCMYMLCRYGDARTVIALASLSLPIIFHLITQEFDQMPGGGIAQVGGGGGPVAAGGGWVEGRGGVE